MTEISAETGLPVLPEPYVWEVASDDDPAYHYREHGWWVRISKPGTKTRDVPTGKRTFWKKRYIYKTETEDVYFTAYSAAVYLPKYGRNEYDTDWNYSDVLPLSKDRVREAAEKAFKVFTAAVENERAEAELLGIYPPKRLHD